MLTIRKVKTVHSDTKGELHSVLKLTFGPYTEETEMPESRDVVVLEAPAKSDTRTLRKSNEAIGLRVTEGRMTLLTRKLLNVLMYYAQTQKTPGMNAPINSPTAHKYFWVPLKDLAKDASYDSNDTKKLKLQLKEMEDIKLLMENEIQWTSERLISSVTFANPKGLNSGSGQVWVGFAFPPEVHEAVMSPATYTKLSILYQGVFRSGASLALYEICRRYATNPSKRTSIEPYEYWYGALTGSAVPAPEDRQPYKYFKRDVIKPAIAEIGALTDIEVTLIEHKNSRRIDRLQFHVEFSKQPPLDFRPAVIDMELLSKVMNVGFSQEDAEDIVALHEESKIVSTLQYLNDRMNLPKASRVESPPALFRWALKNGDQAIALHQAKKGKPGSATATAPAPGANDIVSMVIAARIQDAIELYRELDVSERQSVYARFIEAHAGSNHKIASFEKLLDHGISRTLLGEWYAADVWGDITPHDMARYIQKLNLVQLSSPTAAITPVPKRVPRPRRKSRGDEFST